MTRVALITGANGITGSALISHLVHHTSPSEWSRILVTSLSPLRIESHDPRVEFLRLDLGLPPASLAAQMRAGGCAGVTHAYFASYAHRDDFGALDAVNASLFSNFLAALLGVVGPSSSSRLAHVALQTGGKHYGLHLRPVPSPVSEGEGRGGEGRGEANFYHVQEDLLVSSCLSSRVSGAGWTYSVVRPQAIVSGRCLGPNGMNSAVTLAVYFRLCAGLGLPARMPTNAVYWEAAEEVTDAGLLAEFTFWASTEPRAANQAFNAVNGEVFVWREMWPRLAGYFGAEGADGAEGFAVVSERGEDGDGEKERGVVRQEFSFVDWARGKRGAWEALCEREGRPEAVSTWDAATWAFQDWVFRRTWNATLSMDKARVCGWKGHRDSYESWIAAFEELRESGQIP